MNCVNRFQQHILDFIYIKTLFNSQIHHFYRNIYMFSISCTNIQSNNSLHLSLLGQVQCVKNGIIKLFNTDYLVSDTKLRIKQ